MASPATRASCAITPATGPRVWLDDVGRKRFEKTLADFEEDRVIARLWAGDASLWKSGPKPDQVTANALGWLTVIDKVRPHAGDLKRFGGEVAGPGFSHIVFMGVDGPSLCTEALRRTRPRIAAHPELIVLDSTVPASVHRLEGRIDPTHTLFVVACKTGTTVEPAAFFDYFFEIVWRSKGDNAGENFIAITNRGTPMEAKARRDVFRRTFLNPDGVVGRYSALSYCGMVPAALMGLDVIALLDRAGIAARACRPETPIGENPGAVLGAALDTLAWLGRDKLTLVVPPPLEALALWIEQLVAGSTGKQGRGIIPVVGEPLDRPGVFGGDRVFVQVRTPDRPGVEDHSGLKALADAGHPVIDLVLADPLDLGAEFFRWEFATALAAHRLGVNPFDQPDVQESQVNARALLLEYQKKGKLPEPAAVASFGGLTLWADPGHKKSHLRTAGPASGRDTFVARLKDHFARAKPGDFVALTQFFEERATRDAILLAIRTHLRNTLKVATTTGYGPRFLHSTGQLHKGGPATGLFLQLTADDGEILPIPDRPFGFATLAKAQALGDFRALSTRGRRVLGLHLGPDVDGGLALLLELIKEAVVS